MWQGALTIQQLSFHLHEVVCDHLQYAREHAKVDAMFSLPLLVISCRRILYHVWHASDSAARSILFLTKHHSSVVVVTDRFPTVVQHYVKKTHMKKRNHRNPQVHPAISWYSKSSLRITHANDSPRYVRPGLWVIDITGITLLTFADAPVELRSPRSTLHGDRMHEVTRASIDMPSRNEEEEARGKAGSIGRQSSWQGNRLADSPDK